MLPKIIGGSAHSDKRGTLYFNNKFNAEAIKRIYFIENIEINFIRAWQGHRIEQRWFCAANGSFEIKLIAIDNWDNPSKKLEQITFIICSEHLDILHIPPGFISSIRAITQNAKLLVLADYVLGEIFDEYRYDPQYFD